MLMLGICFTQTYEDVVILKNGSEIHGIIIEQKPNEYIKIQSGKNIFVFQMDEIELMKKELLQDAKTTSKNIDKTKSIAIGFGTNRSMTLLGISRDFKIGKNGSFFLTSGIGTALFGLGLGYQSDYNNNGINLSTTLGAQLILEYGILPSWHNSINYQWNTGGQSFISVGLMGGIFWYEDCWWYCSAEVAPYILPTVSYDIRF